MNNLLGLGVFGTFGKPYGFQQIFYVGTEYYFDKVFNSTLDLNTNAIEVFPSTELYAVKREISNGIHSICICKYSYANEINSNRGGTFIGSCILLNETILDASVIYAFLEELHHDVVSSEKNIINSTLQVNEAIQLHVNEPTNFDKAKSQLNFLKGTDFYSTTVNKAKKFLIAPKTNEDKATQVKTFIENSIKYFNDVDTLYFTFDEKAISYVNQKALLKSFDWQKFIDRKEEVIKEREEKKKIEEQQRRELERNKQNKNINSNDGKFRSWEYKKQTWDKNEVKRRVDEYNRLLDYCFELDSQKSPQVRQITQNLYHSQRQHTNREETFFEQNKTTVFLVINLLFIAFVSIYLLFFNEPEIRYYSKPSEDVIEHSEPKETKTEKLESLDLQPTPNSELNANDRKRVEKIGIKGKSGKDIIQTIFQQNPTDIKSHYANQVNQYLEYLISKNPDCFTKDSDICNCDSLILIPSYKKDKQ